MKNGVYVNSDIEIVITDHYMITYRRNIKKNTLESRLFKKQDGTFTCIGICVTDPAGTDMNHFPTEWKNAFVFRDSVIGLRQTAPENAEKSSKQPAYVKENDEQIKAHIGTTLDIETKENQVTVTFDDGMMYVADADEIFSQADIHPVVQSAHAGNVGECLRAWQMGVQEEIFKIGGEPTFIGVIINTARHMFIFEMTPDSIYCRAARFVAIDKGMVFNQNFRQGYTAYMIEDNNDIRKPLEYDDALFSNDACVWNSRSVYWSVDSIEDDKITLHGCQGDTYRIKKPNRS